MKMSEEQIRGNVNTIEQELLVLILDELRKKDLMPFEEPQTSGFLQVESITTTNSTEKPKQKRGKPAKKKTQK